MRNTKFQEFLNPVGIGKQNYHLEVDSSIISTCKTIFKPCRCSLKQGMRILFLRNTKYYHIDITGLNIPFGPQELCIMGWQIIANSCIIK